jgi:hypothetical protein
MNAKSQLGRQSATSTRTATFSARVVFDRVRRDCRDQLRCRPKLITSAPFTGAATKTEAVGIDPSFAVFSPLRLIETLVGGTSETAGHPLAHRHHASG